MKNLTSIAKHSDWLETTEYWYNKRWQLHRKRVLFGKQPLEIWQFVPCKLVDGVWAVLEEPNKYTSNLEINDEYQQAKDRCLFEGFEYDKYGFSVLKNKKGCGFDEEYMTEHTIEDLVKYNLELTKTAQKQLGL